MKILDLEITDAAYDEILKQIQLNLSTRSHFSFSYVNAYIALAARENESLRSDLREFSVLYSDGIGVLFASKFLFGKSGLSKRINGTDLYYKILSLAEEYKYKVFFFGGGETAAKALLKTLEEKYPRLEIGGIIERDITTNDSILQKINHSNSDILFLGLGTPYQEKWIASFRKKCNIPIQISVGSGIDFLSGTYKRAPILFRKFGLEWLFRLILEPKRLWKRYLIGIPTFIIKIIKQKLS